MATGRGSAGPPVQGGALPAPEVLIYCGLAAGDVADVLSGPAAAGASRRMAGITHASEGASATSSLSSFSETPEALTVSASAV